MSRAALLTLLLFFFLAQTTQAEEAKSYTLTYQNQNKWVSQADNAPLRALVDEAKAKKVRVFHVFFPSQKRELAVARLKILRDILTRSLAEGVVLVEVEGTAEANTLRLTPVPEAAPGP
jgi:hypothetical protein